MLHARLSHVALRVTDLSATRRFYEDNLGLSPVVGQGADSVRLGLGLGGHVLELSSRAGCEHFALELASDRAVSDLGRHLNAHGVATEVVASASGHHHPMALRFADPDGHAIELHGPTDRSGEARGGVGRRPLRLHHITLTTESVPDLVEFYVSVLGFSISDRMGDQFAWMRCGPEHHTVAIVEGPGGGLDHYCYEVEDWEDLRRWCDELAAGGVSLSWGPGRHGPGNNLFVMVDDPDGVHIELSCDMERFWDELVTYPEPRNWAPGGRSVNLWGPTPEWRRGLDSPATRS